MHTYWNKTLEFPFFFIVSMQKFNSMFFLQFSFCCKTMIKYAIYSSLANLILSILKVLIWQTACCLETFFWISCSMELWLNAYITLIFGGTVQEINIFKHLTPISSLTTSSLLLFYTTNIYLTVSLIRSLNFRFN